MHVTQTFNFLKAAAGTEDVLSVAVYNYTVSTSQAKVTFRVDFPESSSLDLETLEGVFLSGLTEGANRLEPDSVVITQGKAMLKMMLKIHSVSGINMLWSPEHFDQTENKSCSPIGTEQ